MNTRKQCGRMWFYCFFVISMVSIIAACASAATLTVNNSNFQAGSGDSSADNWTETSDVYYKPAEGYYMELDTIVNRAASFKSSGVAAIYQNIANTYTDSYDVYKVSFDIGYRCDLHTEYAIDAFRVSLYDTYSGNEIKGEDIIIGKPEVDGSQSPNVDTIVSRTVVLRPGRLSWPHHQLALRFDNLADITNHSNATAVLDNVSLKAYLLEGAWGLNNSLEDSTLENHDGSALPSRIVSYSSSGTAGTSCLSLSRTGNNRGVSVPYSGDLNGNDFTVTAWAYVNNSSLTYYRAVISSRNAGTSSNRSGYVLYATPNAKWSFRTGSGASDGWDELGDAISDAGVATGQWTFLAINFTKTDDYGTDGKEVLGTKRLYINGKLVGTKENVRFRRVSSLLAKPLLIGAGANESANYNYDYYFDGKLDDVRYYNYRLTSAEIADIYTAVKDYSTPSSVGSYFKVMSYNVKSFSYNGARRDEIRDIVNEQDPDVLCLQEVKNDSGQLAWLAGQVGMNYYVFCNTYDSIHGNAILSRTPILTYNKYELPQSPILEQLRACMLCNIEINGRMYTFANTHLTHTTPFGEDEDAAEATRAMQVDSILNTVNYCSGPIILTGDFNSKWNDPAIDHLQQSFWDSRLCTGNQGDAENNEVDFIMIDNNHFSDSVTYAETIINSDTEVASDHKPVVTTFMLD